MIADWTLLYGIIAGVGIALIISVLGCFVVWQRMAYFGESLAHSSFLGIALGVVLGVDENIGIIVVCFAFAIVLVLLQQKKMLSNDALMGLLSHSALSLGVIVLSFLGQEHGSQHIHDDLFGNIFDVSPADIVWIYGTVSVVFLWLFLYWPSLVLLSVSEDLACAEGVAILPMRLLLVLLMTITVAISLKILGILLITSLLIIPAVTARIFSRSPKEMAVFSTIIGCFSVIGGILFSFYFKKLPGPSIISFSALVFFVAIISQKCFFLIKTKR